MAKETSLLPVVGRLISMCLQSSYPTYLNPGFNFQVNRVKGSNNNKKIRGLLRLHKINITLNVMADQSQIFRCSPQKTVKAFPKCAPVHGKQKDDKMPLYLTALCHPQLLTPQEVVEVINTSKRGHFVLSYTTQRDNRYRVKS